MLATPTTQAMPTLIEGATVLLPSASGCGLRSVRADVYLDSGVIAGIDTVPVGFDVSAAKRIDAHGLMLLPGMVDLCARFGTTASAWHEAVAGGITAFFSPGKGVIDRYVVSASMPQRAVLGREDISSADSDAGAYAADEMVGRVAGAVASGMASLPRAGLVEIDESDVDAPQLRNAMLRARAAGASLWFRPQDRALAGHGVMASGTFAVRLGLAGVPAEAETAPISRIVALMRDTGASVHLSRLSSAGAVALVRDAKADGLALTCDVSAHHVHLIDVDIGWFDSRFRLDPPLRAAIDRDALRRGLADGTIDAICSDHTPHSVRAKAVPFAQAPAGAPGFAYLLALTIKWATEDRIPMADAITRVTSVPAAIVGHQAWGIVIGRSADMLLIDPDDYWDVPDIRRAGGEARETRALSPFSGFELPAPIREVWVAGCPQSEFWDKTCHADTLQDL